MRLISLISSVCLLAGCNQRGKQVLEYGYGIMLGLLTLVSILGALAVWRTIRRLRQPDGYSIMGSLTMGLTPALPMFYFMPVMDAGGGPQVAITVSLLGFYLFVLVCFVLSVVRWTRTFRYKD